VTSFYFCVTTLVTVGYGDITAYSIGERAVCSCLMILGVVSFSIATGALSSIITSYDSKEALLKEKIATLNEISNEYMINIDLFNKLARTIKYDHSKKSRDTL
jgi:Ion channel